MQLAKTLSKACVRWEAKSRTMLRRCWSPQPQIKLKSKLKINLRCRGLTESVSQGHTNSIAMLFITLGGELAKGFEFDMPSGEV